MSEDKKLKDILIEKWQNIIKFAIEEEQYEIAEKAKRILENLKK